MAQITPPSGSNYVDASAVSAVEASDPLTLAGDVTIAAGKTLAVDVVAEKTAGTGVTLDSVLLKDGLVDGVDVAARDHAVYTNAEAVVAVEAEATLVLAGDVTIANAKSLGVNTINEFDADTGVTIDTVLIKDGLVDGVDVSAISSGGWSTLVTTAGESTALTAQTDTEFVSNGSLSITADKGIRIRFQYKSSNASGVGTDSFSLAVWVNSAILTNLTGLSVTDTKTGSGYVEIYYPPRSAGYASGGTAHAEGVTDNAVAPSGVRVFYGPVAAANNANLIPTATITDIDIHGAHTRADCSMTVKNFTIEVFDPAA